MRAALQAGEFEELGDGRFRVAGHELEPDEVLVERAGQGRLGGRRRGRRHGRARHRARRGARARAARLRPDPPVNRCARTQGSSSPTASHSRSRGRRRPARARRLDPARDARARWSTRTASPPCTRVARSQTGLRARRRPSVPSASRARGGARPGAGSARPRRPSGTARSSSTPRARNQSQTRSTSFSGAEAPDVMPTVSTPVEPALVDLGLVVDQVRRHARRAGDVDEAVRVRRVRASRSRARGRSRRASP